MSFLIGVLTFVLVINCLLLILLVLVQLPKKDAGAGMAFGAGTADALFGAGSGNALTKITKYAAGILLLLCLLLGYLHDRAQHDTSAADFATKVDQTLRQTTANTPAPKPANTSANNLLTTQPTTGTNAAK